MATNDDMLRDIHQMLFPKKKTPAQSDEEFKANYIAALNRKKYKRLSKSKN